MLANAGNRFKSGVPRRNGANPYWRGLVMLYTAEQVFVNSRWLLIPNPAAPGRDMGAVSWGADATDFYGRDKQGPYFAQRSEAGPYWSTGTLPRWAGTNLGPDKGIAFFGDWTYRGFGFHLFQNGWQSGGFRMSQAGGTTLQGVVSVSGLDDWAASVAALSNTTGDRNRGYVWYSNNQAQAIGNGQAGTIATNANAMTAHDDALYSMGQDWNADADLNMLAMWVGPPLPEPAAKRLTLHPNPIELFR